MRKSQKKYIWINRSKCWSTCGTSDGSLIDMIKFQVEISVDFYKVKKIAAKMNKDLMRLC